MGNLTRMIYLAAVMAATAMQGFAAEPIPVIPPFQEPQEEWVLQFDNYKNEYGDRSLSRDVVIVRDESELYIKGIFAEYPDSWLKGTVDGSNFKIGNTQFLGQDDEGGDVYFYCGSFKSSFSGGNTYQYVDMYFRSNRKYGSFSISDDGSVMTADQKEASFWYTAGDEDIWFWEHRDLEYTQNSEYWVTTGTGFPDRDYMLKMRFQKKGESGIGGIGGDSVNGSAAPMYNLQGQLVDPATAGPGIYIRNGKKIVKNR